MNCDCTRQEIDLYGQLEESEDQITELQGKLKALVADLTDSQEWRWTEMTAARDAADKVLAKLARLRLIEMREHPHGGRVYRVAQTKPIYGRNDDLGRQQFEAQDV